MKDRSELFRLYPEVGKRTDNLSYRAANLSPTKDDVKISFWYVVTIAALLTMPLSVSVLMMNYYRLNTEFFSDPRALPMIAISAALLGVLIFVALKGISKRLEKTGINIVVFMWIYALCGLPISQLIYNLYQRFNDGVVYALPLTGMLFIENLIFVASIIGLMFATKSTARSKFILLVLFVVFGVFATFASGS